MNARAAADIGCRFCGKAWEDHADSLSQNEPSQCFGMKKYYAEEPIRRNEFAELHAQLERIEQKLSDLIRSKKP